MAFLSEFVRFRPLSLAVVFVLMLARSVSEMVGFLLLVPMLEFAGVVPSAGGGSLSAVLRRFHGFFGIEVTLSSVLTVFFATMLLRALLGYASTLQTARFLAGWTEHFRQGVYVAFSRASWLHLTGAREAQDMHALTMQTEGVANAGYYLVNLAASLTTIAMGAAAAFVLSPHLTIAVLLAAVAMAVPLMLFHRSAYQRGAATLQAVQRLYEILGARMGGLKLAKAFSIEKALEQDFAASSFAYADATIAARRDHARATLLHDAGAALILVVLVYFSLQVLQTSGMEMIVLIAIFGRVMPLAANAQSGMRSIAGLLPDYASVSAMKRRALAAQEALASAGEPMLLRDGIELDDVGFSYEGSDEPALRHLNLRIAARSAIGVMGLSGAGKSTLADIISGLIPSGNGNVRIDGVRLDGQTRANWRASVAYVPQDAPLFDETLRENLRIGARQASDADIWESLEIVSAAELVRSLPAGLDTLAGNRGVRLSGGERQRLRLASALLRKPQVLILDESTSALNPADEAMIVRSLDRLRHAMTIVVIAHRASSIRWTDRLIVVHNGAIVADGTPAEVLDARPDLEALRQ